MKRLQIESKQNRDFIEKEKSDRITQVRKLESDVCLAEKGPTSPSSLVCFLKTLRCSSTHIGYKILSLPQSGPHLFGREQCIEQCNA